MSELILSYLFAIICRSRDISQFHENYFDDEISAATPRLFRNMHTRVPAPL